MHVNYLPSKLASGSIFYILSVVICFQTTVLGAMCRHAYHALHRRAMGIFKMRNLEDAYASPKSMSRVDILMTRHDIHEIIRSRLWLWFTTIHTPPAPISVARALRTGQNDARRWWPANPRTCISFWFHFSFNPRNLEFFPSRDPPSWRIPRQCHVMSW